MRDLFCIVNRAVFFLVPGAGAVKFNDRSPVLYFTPSHPLCPFCLSSGYGHSTPKTDFGKFFTMAYATIGIPLGLVMFNSIGERLNNFASIVINKLRKVLNCLFTR